MGEDNKEIQLNAMQAGYNPLEVAKIVGEPVDPRKPYTGLCEQICETDTAEPNDFYYYYDVLLDTDKVINITSSGELLTENVVPDAPALASFTDLSTPEYYVKVTDLASAKERTLARKLKTINRALNEYEDYKILSLVSAGATTASHTHTLRSSYTRFVFPDLIDMIEDVQDYGSNYVLIAGAQIMKDISLWDWDDNKFHSPQEALRELNVKTVRIPSATAVFQYSDTGASAGGFASTDVLSTNVAYLVAVDSEMGKPILFVRKRLNDIDLLGGAIKDNGDKPQRLVFVSPNPVVVTAGPTRFLAVGMTGFEEITGAVKNPYALSKFTRS